MQSSRALQIKVLTWNDIRQEVKKVNQGLADIIDNLSPDDSYKIYKVSYPFGSMIFNRGILNLPNNSENLTSLHDYTTSSNIKEDLSYRAIPMGLMLKKSSEVFIERENRFIPLTILSEGTIFGAWETLDPPQSYFIKLAWNVSSGARSMFMLPKISEKSGYKRLQKEFDIRINSPKELKDHWDIFKKLTNCENFPSPWQSEVLFFSKKWFEKITLDKEWLSLKLFLYEVSWQQSMFWRYTVTMNLVWQELAAILKKINMKMGTYPLETLKHLMTLSVGGLPTFSAFHENEIMAPITALQKIFLDIYGIDYIPTVMTPQYLSLKKGKSIGYYSINEPTLIESVPKSREVINIMQVTREVKELFGYFKEEVIKDNLMVKNTPIYTLIQNTNFDFIHTKHDPAHHLISSSHLPDDDPALVLSPNTSKKLSFCSSSHFLRGCIRITIK